MSTLSSRRSSRSIWVAVALCMLLWGVLLPPETAWGQGGSTASIAGTVKDASGAVVPAAQVVITQTDTGFSQSKESANDGTFVFPILPVGPYRLEVKKEGFSTYLQTGIVLTVNQAANLSVTLKLGEIRQTVEVKERASPVETTTGTLSNIVDRRQVVDLPLNGRNPAELVLLAPGVVNMLGNSAMPAGTLQFSYPAGIGASSVSQGAQAPVVNGMRPGNVSFTLDGANNTDPYSVSGGPFPNPDAVQEFRVLTSGYGADYASAPGGVVNIVTKSGTNEFHGNVFEFLRNGALNARNFFAAKTDAIKRNQFGGTAGGPLRKDKLFIFGSYQGTTLRNFVGGNIAFVPTDAQRAGNFSSTANQLKNPWTGAPYSGNQIPLTDFSPVASGILPHLPRSTAPDGRVEVVFTNPQNEKQLTLKSDYVQGKHSFVMRYLLSDFNSPIVPNNNWLAGNLMGQGLGYRWQDATLGHNYASGQWVNEFRFTVQRNGYHSVSAIQQSIKDFGANISSPAHHYMETTAVDGFFALHSQSSETFPRTTFIMSDRWHMMRGRHQLSLGVEVSRLQAKLTTDHLQSGNSMWGSLPPYMPFTSGNVLSDFVLGKVTMFMQGDGLLVRAQGTLWGFYGTDEIRVTPRLNLSLGLRWDPYWPFHTLHGRINCFIPGQQSTVFTEAPTGILFPGDTGCNASGTNSDLNTFQPRIGFAYRLDQKGHTSIRGGYGMYATQFPMQMYLPFGSVAPYIRSITRFAPYSITEPWLGSLPFSPDYPGGDPFASGFNYNDLPLPSNTAFPTPLTAAAFAQNFKLGNLQKWNLTLEHLFPGNTLVRASYVGDKGTHLSLGNQANPAVYIPGDCGGTPCSTSANTDARRLYASTGLGGVNIAQSDGNSTYHAFQLSVERRLATGLNFTSNYTWGKSIDVQSQSPINHPCCTAFFNIVSNPFNVNAFRGLSAYDLSHSLSTSVVWQFPSLAKRSLPVKHVIGGWQVSGIWQWQTGQPFSVYAGMDNSLSGVGWDYADRVPGVSPLLDPGRPHAQLVNQYFNVAAFQQNALGTFGNSGRNILRGPGFNNLDMGIMKVFPIKGEKYHVEFRGEFFNITNTPHFGLGPQPLPSPQAGKILGARDPRIIQFALKFNW